MTFGRICDPPGEALDDHSNPTPYRKGGPLHPVRVRPLEWTDFGGWVALYYTRYDEVRTNPALGVFTMAEKPSMGDEAALFGTVWRSILAGDHVSTVAEEGGSLVGLCSISRMGFHVEDRHVATLGIAVHPSWRGKGVGTKLFDHALKACEGKFETVLLHVIDVNEPAQRLYRKFGFEECGRYPRTFRRGGVYYDEICMVKHVGGPRGDG
jgi:ribosomal protein S18 acetylase RimI-like enzyme